MKDESKQLPKCLLVDDLEDNIVALRGLLQDEEIEIMSANSGVQALELLLKHDFAVAIIDVQMPNMSGFELAEIMRSTEKTRSIPIVFVTAASDNQKIFEGYEAGAVDFLQKPLAPPVVLGKLRVFLELFNQKKLLEAKLKKIKETESYLQKALKSRDEFLSVVSHELKTPLTSLKLQIQMTNRRREKLGEKEALSVENTKKFLVQADQSVDRIVHLVNDMLDISRVTTGKLSINPEPVDFSSMVKEVTERLYPYLELADVELKMDLDQDIRVKLDPFRIEQVLTNLLTNVAKYAPHAPVEVSTIKKDKYALLCVKDHGEGIGPEDQKRIFQRFERVSHNSSVSGMGLGLYISKEIVELHGGTLSVESKPGAGSLFTMKLPLVEGIF